MRLDNSAANTFRQCPWLYYETYQRDGTGLEAVYKDEKVRPMDLGTRVHELLEEYYRELKGDPREPYTPSENEDLEEEAQVIISAYKAQYPIELFEIVDVERNFEVVLPDYCPECYSVDVCVNAVNNTLMFCESCDCDFKRGRHSYTGKIDVMYRQDGLLYIMDHKTEKRGSKSNDPQKWAAKDQGTQYLWAAEKIYNEPIERFIVNILTRPSDAGVKPPSFPERQRIERTEIQLETALRDLVVTADLIEKYMRVFGEKPWPAHRDNCKTWGLCEFYIPHLYGWSDTLKKYRFQPKTPYLSTEGLVVIQ